ncbi:MAG: hypothetical protein DRQ62_14220 [Gammaproteobacteria bacterium]|nr:MAG: hypothetical protein DRQ62_14220 [Gammaproteobacteria bacterium]
MQEADDNIYNCDDKDLGGMLQRLFDEGHTEVEVMHPTDGPVIVTKSDFKKHLANIEKVKNMSPADRVTENARLRNVKKRKQIRFRTELVNAPVHKVDLDGGKFGIDADGNELDVAGMTFVSVKDYPKGTDLKTGEVGCFIDTAEIREPMRITAEE